MKKSLFKFLGLVSPFALVPAVAISCNDPVSKSKPQPEQPQPEQPQPEQPQPEQPQPESNHITINFSVKANVDNPLEMGEESIEMVKSTEKFLETIFSDNLENKEITISYIIKEDEGEKQGQIQITQEMTSIISSFFHINDLVNNKELFQTQLLKQKEENLKEIAKVQEFMNKWKTSQSNQAKNEIRLFWTTRSTIIKAMILSLGMIPEMP
ncbi:hypothetical protein [Mycoplasmopsis gallopavonis]|uniref:Lipoprotein n=1 Tax=Mycoplasmopsis gallopavonis TaxID=76629 RepID=A0A449AYS2_9BACT|nr:hypothetical protein [Mycoplasmopsis gallopavonis]RIV16499.1 hypothetical protein D1113_02095 [Mycoplasmopsis gallopavonis]VEU72596.1 Uncharacterised protein [Mycoplasmopsis gallopavonis]